MHRYVDYVARGSFVASQPELPAMPQAEPGKGSQKVDSRYLQHSQDPTRPDAPKADLATTPSNTPAEARAKMRAKLEITGHAFDLDQQAAERAPDKDWPDRSLAGKDIGAEFVHVYASW